MEVLHLSMLQNKRMELDLKPVQDPCCAQWQQFAAVGGRGHPEGSSPRRVPLPSLNSGSVGPVLPGGGGGGGVTVLTGSTHLPSPPIAAGCWHSTTAPLPVFMAAEL